VVYTLDLLEELIRTPGIPGYEGPIRAKIAEKIKGYGTPEIDGIGNMILTLGEGTRHVAFVAHMDELGAVVSHIEENGYVKLRKLGMDDRSMAGRVYNIYTSKGPLLGVTGIKAPHLVSDPEELKKVIPGEKLLLDVGARSRKEVEKMGIRVLDPVVLKKDFNVINNKIVTARGLDNRVGCTALIESMQILSKLTLKCRMTFAWSVQEEIGLRGAAVIGHTVKPDIVFPIDTFSTADSPDAPTHYSPVYLGKGPVLRMIDNRAIASYDLKAVVEEVAKKSKIPVQLGVTGGSTDGAALQETGSTTLPLGVPMRYTHSPTEFVHIDDVNNLIKLISKLIERYAKG
jgi:putative aminopeptidase FrvX